MPCPSTAAPGRKPLGAGARTAVVADRDSARAQALAEERFLVLTHGFVQEQLRRKADNPQRWLCGTQRLHAQLGLELGDAGRHAPRRVG